MLKIFNSLTRKIEKFEPLNPPKVGVYACGPTVYDYIHIGNLRSFIFFDVLRRLLIANGYEVKFVENITDIEDKIIKRSKEKDITPEQLTQEYTKYFLDDLIKLNILLPDVNPKATEHIGKIIKFIEDLVEKKLAYIEEDGSVYFDISEFSDYGKLSQVEKRELKSGTRSLSDEYTKEDVSDFALWKSVKTDEYGWDSPWGKGRPGWHIECSVMAQEYLGDTLDIHLGGIDLLFPHHENEVAQAEGRSGKQFSKYFVHGEHLLVDGKKMSKSLNNFFTLRDIEERNFEPLGFRYLLLTAHYRDKLNFTWESLQASHNALNNIREIIREWRISDSKPGEYYQRFLKEADMDLGLPKALAIMHELIQSDLDSSQKSADLLAMDQILGLRFNEYIGKRIEIPGEVQDFVEKREKAREQKAFDKADSLRHDIRKLGYEVEDTPNGSKVKKLI